MRLKILYITTVIFLLSGGCVKQYVPDIGVNEQMLVIEGIITDLPGRFTIKVNRSQPLWRRVQAFPLKNCKVWITDDLGESDTLRQTLTPGVYVTDSTRFRPCAGRKYTLHINTPAEFKRLKFESYPMLMKPSPPIDSLYYEKRNFVIGHEPVEGCQIYLDTHNPQSTTGFYRWDFTETWEFHIPYNFPNRKCWITEKSNTIMIKNASGYYEDMVKRYPLYLISNPVERLLVKYSILVSQYSLNEEEFYYWENLKNLMENVGSLYDIIPANVPNNIFCLDDPNEKVLGYFSVSSVTSKRMFIEERFMGINHYYDDCATDTVFGTGPIRGIDTTLWVIVDGLDNDPPFRIVTDKKPCIDCSARGSLIRPVFW